MKLDTEKFWKDFSGGLRAFIARRVSDSSSVDDILQDVFLKVHVNIDSLENDAKIRGWVYRIARNTIIDFYRKRKKRTLNLETALPDDDAPAYDGKTEENPAAEIAAGLRKMTEALPEQYAEALLLVDFEGLPQVELARRLGISPSGAKSRVQRGRQMLRDLLMRCCHFEFDRYGTIIDHHPIRCCCCHGATSCT